MKLSELTWTQVNRTAWMSQPLKAPNDSAEIRVLRHVQADGGSTYRAVRDGLGAIDTGELFEFVSYLQRLQPRS